jgi:hypothetical protein
MAIKVLETHQHHFFSGMTKAQVDAYFVELDAAILAEMGRPVSHPRPHYYELEVTERDRCPWGKTWFVTKDDGTLEQFRANWDSSG